MSNERVVAFGLVVGFALSCVGFATEVGSGWALLWGGILIMLAALFFDARGDG